MSRPLWFVHLIKEAFPGRFLAARMTRLPLLGSILDTWFFAGDDLIYLPKTRVVPVHRSLDPPGEVVLPFQIVDHFIQLATYHWVMNSCICRDAAGCRDYPVDLGCLFLGEAAAGINPRLGRRVSREEAWEHARRCRDTGLVHLIGRNKLDTLWLGVGPGSRLLTICNCCPCCCLWRVLPYIAPRVSSKVTRMPGVTVNVSDQCVGCGQCTQGVCFVDAIHLVNGQAVISDACRGCGRCISVCPGQAIEITIEDDHIVQESIAHISGLVDVS